MNCANVIAVATGRVENNYSALFHTHGGAVVLGKKCTNSILGGNGSGEVKSYPSCTDDSGVSSRSNFNCEREGCSIELVVNSRQCPSLS